MVSLSWYGRRSQPRIYAMTNRNDVITTSPHPPASEDGERPDQLTESCPASGPLAPSVGEGTIDSIQMTSALNLKDPELYLNRELAQLEFNFRVLSQAQDPAVPLLERLRFLCISNSNLDEFFEVQVAILRHHVAFGDALPGPDGMLPGELLTRIRNRALELVRLQYAFWNDTLLPELVR